MNVDNGYTDAVVPLPRRAPGETIPDHPALTSTRYAAHAALAGSDRDFDGAPVNPTGGPLPDHVDGTSIGRAPVHPPEPPLIADDMGPLPTPPAPDMPDASVQGIADEVTRRTGRITTPEDVSAFLGTLPAMLSAIAAEEAAKLDAEQAPEEWESCRSFSPTGLWCRREHSHPGPCVGWQTGGPSVEQWTRR